MGEVIPNDRCSRRTCATLYYHAPPARTTAVPGTSGAKVGGDHYEDKMLSGVLDSLDATFEFEENSWGTGELVTKALKRVALSGRSQQDNFLRKIFPLKVRGQITTTIFNQKQKIAHVFLGKTSKVFSAAEKITGHVGNVVSFAQEAVTSWDHIQSIIDSPGEKKDKQAKLAFEASAFGARMLYAAGVSTPVTIYTFSLRLFGTPLKAMGYGGVSAWADKVDKTESTVHSKVDEWISGDEIYTVLTHTVTLRPK